MKRLFDYVREKHLDKWVPGYARHWIENRRAEEIVGPRHVLFAFCDHWEPLHGGVDEARGDERVEKWRVDYPKLAREFTDADGRHPCHSFFFPGEQYKPAWLDVLAGFAKERIGEVELHLHHDNDTHEKLERDLKRYLQLLAGHGHFSRQDGRVRYGFIHGNWCLANSREDGRWCGVDDELPLLFETGCYADYTFPSAPDESQPNVVNRIYWPTGDLARKRAYEGGERAKVGTRHDDRVLMIEGPLALARKPGRMPIAIENAAVTAADPAVPRRVKTWIEQSIHVEGRPEWIFVKVHTHGAPDAQAASLLGDGGRMLHEALTRRYNDGERHVLHYVSAREMFNVAMAAIDGKRGDPNEHRNYILSPPPAASRVT